MRFGNNIVFRRAGSTAGTGKYFDGERATMKGVAYKTITLLLVAIVSALLCMVLIKPLDNTATSIIILGYLISPIITLILSFVISYNPTTAKVLSIPYCILQGISIGTLTGLLTAFLGSNGALLVGLAFVITLTFFLGATVLYTTNIVKVTNKMRIFLFTALIGIVFTSIMVSILSLFIPSIRTFVYGNGGFAFLYAIICVIIASLYTFITLDNAYRLVDMGVSKNIEWYASFGIVVNVIWLFYEVLRLIMIIFSRRN